jgi:hypothetical protein
VSRFHLESFVNLAGSLWSRHPSTFGEECDIHAGGICRTPVAFRIDVSPSAVERLRCGRCSIVQLVRVLRTNALPASRRGMLLARQPCVSGDSPINIRFLSRDLDEEDA